MQRATTDVQFVFLPIEFWGFTKSKFRKALGSNALEIGVTAATTFILENYKLKNSWQKQTYSLTKAEERMVFELGLQRLLVYPPQLYSSKNWLLEDSEYYVVKLDSATSMLCERIKGVSILEQLRLFLMENSGLRGFAVIAKDFHNKVYPEGETKVF